MQKKILLLFLITFLVCNKNFAQEPVSIHLTEKDGLPDIEFYDILEDSKKFIWLAADKGLYRYNGKKYDYFSNELQEGNSLFGLKEDQNQQIWCNNLAGQFFYTKGNKLHLFYDLGAQLNGELTNFIITPKALIVFLSTTVLEIDLSNKSLKRKDLKNSLVGFPHKKKSSYLYSKKDFIIKTDKYFQKKDSLQINILKNVNPKSGLARGINVISNDFLNICYFLKFNSNQFYLFSFKNKSFIKLKTPKKITSKRIHHIFFNDDEIWFATNQGIYVYTIQNDVFYFKKQFFKNINTTKIVKDSFKNYWVITKGNGIYVMPNIYISKYNFPKDAMNISSFKKIDKAHFIFGTINGKIGILNTKNQQIKILDTSSALEVTDIFLNDIKNNATIIKEDKLFRFYGNTNRFSKLDSILTIIGAKKISQFNNKHIISSYKEAFITDADFNFEKKLINKRSFTNYYSKKSKLIYVATIDGLFSFDETYKSKELTYKNRPILAKSFTETIDGIIWVSTFKNGVLGIKNNQVFVNYTTKNGLLSNRTGVIKADENLLWITTEKGIQLLDTKEKTLKNLVKKNGIPSYRISSVEITTDKVYFASNVGLFNIKKDKVFQKNKSSKIYFTEVVAASKSLPIQAKYQLKHNEKDIKISFNSNGFQSSLNRKYQYRLLGENATWKTTEAFINHVNYNSLPSGNYTFEIKPLFDSDDNSKKTLYFKIAKPFWNNWWFYILTLIFTSTIVLVLFNFKIKQIRKKQEDLLQKELIKKQLVLSQLENLRSQMNPHFVFNALNSIQEYIVLNKRELASSFLVKFSRLIRIYLDHSREDEVKLEAELKALKIYLELEKNRFEDELTYTINVSNNIKTSTIKIPSLFIQPYVENALKHGLLHKKSDRKLTLDFTLNTLENILICKITDNGIGIEASKKLNKNRKYGHKSFSTDANQKRIDLLNLDRKEKIELDIINRDTEYISGTIVIIKIPI